MSDWIREAACRDADPALFFPTDPRPNAYGTARAMCGGCPVRSECLADALATEAHKVRWGMRAGLTPGQRDKLAGKPALTCDVCGRSFHSDRLTQTWCSQACKKVRETLYMREYQRSQRNNGKANPVGLHGGISCAQSGCQSPACIGRRRTERRISRIRARNR